MMHLRKDYNDALGQSTLHFQAALCFLLNVLLVFEIELIIL